MARADWTYELPAIGDDSAGLEDYEALSASGDRVGTVAVVLERGGEQWVVVERGNPPAEHERRAVPWDDVAGVDHERLAVHLQLEEPDLDQMLELDPGRGAEGRRDVDAVRVRDIPETSTPAPEATAGGPRDTPKVGTAIGLHILSAFLLLVVVVLATREGASRSVLWLLLVPAVVSGAAFLLSYRAARRPYASSSRSGGRVPR